MFRDVDFEAMIDLDGLEPGEIEVKADLNQSFEFAAESIVVPTRIFGKAVQRETKGADFSIGAACDDHDPNVVPAEALKRLPAADFDSLSRNPISFRINK